jgi:hypothetical protein
VVEVDGAGVAARLRGLGGGEEAAGDRGERAWAGGAGAVADFLRAGAEVPGGHAGVRGGRGQDKLFWRRRHERGLGFWEFLCRFGRRPATPASKYGRGTGPGGMDFFNKK